MSPPSAAPFTLIRLNGETILFDDLLSLKRHLRAARIHVGDYHTAVWTFDGNHFNRVITKNEWIVRDLYGRRVTQSMIDAIIDPAAPRRSNWYRRWGSSVELQAHAAKLGLPIPKTGKRTRYRNYLRYPRHMSVYRAEAALWRQPDDEKAKGKIHLPPNAWDDYHRRDFYDRNWKRHRKTQYRGKVA